jgi:hypothetical protein
VVEGTRDAHISAFLELIEIGNISVGLYDTGPCRTRRHETPAELLKRLLHVRTHVVDTDAADGRAACALAGNEHDLADAAGRYGTQM